MLFQFDLADQKKTETKDARHMANARLTEERGVKKRIARMGCESPRATPSPPKTLMKETDEIIITPMAMGK